MNTTLPPATPSAPTCDVNPVADVMVVVAAINAEIANPIASEAIALAMRRLSATQSLATAMQDAVNDLRAHATVELAAVGAAATQLVTTGDVPRWTEAIAALQMATARSQQRLTDLLVLTGALPHRPPPPA